MQVIAARVGYANIDALDSRFPLSPIVAVLSLSAQRPVGHRQGLLVPPKTIERRVEPAIAQGRETDDSHIDAYRRPSGNRTLDLLLRQDGNEPFPARTTDSYVPHPAQNAATIAVAQPTEPRQ